MQPAGEGHLERVTKVFPTNVPGIDYVLYGFNLPPDSVLSVRWYRDGRPLESSTDEYSGEMYSGSDRIRWANASFRVDRLEPGEYQLQVTLDGTPVYADVLVVD